MGVGVAEMTCFKTCVPQTKNKFLVILCSKAQNMFLLVCYQETIVEHFEQHLGAAHSKHWLEYAFSIFLNKIAEKEVKAKN